MTLPRRLSVRLVRHAAAIPLRRAVRQAAPVTA